MRFVARPPVPDRLPGDEVARCTGHCCRSFIIRRSMEAIRAEAEDGDADSATMVDMVIPVRVTAGVQVYDCRHLRANGDCSIYESRPRMCRDYPGSSKCTFDGCTRLTEGE